MVQWEKGIRVDDYYVTHPKRTDILKSRASAISRSQFHISQNVLSQNFASKLGTSHFLAISPIFLFRLIIITE